MTSMRTLKSSQCFFVTGGNGGAGATHGYVKSVLVYYDSSKISAAVGVSPSP
ncbi:MAG: hypothetical protein HRT54_24020 [Colwellia sp.]|nr:hypothetical protein [Colwellia sp.]